MRRTAIVIQGLALTALAATARPDPAVVATEVVGPFTGHDARLHPANLEPERIAYYGTDLGFSYEHDGRIVFLFGDTWATEAYAPIEASTGSRFDDGLGSIRLADWPDPAAIRPGNVPRIQLLTNPGTNEMAAVNPGHAMDLGKTPMHGFSNGRDEFAIFNLTKPQGCRTDGDCGPGLVCDPGLGYIGSRYDEEEQLTLPCIDGSPACMADTMVDPDGNDLPGSGFCVDPTSSVWSDTPAGRAAGVALNQRIGMRSRSDPRRYKPTWTWRTNKFLNVTARTVRHFAVRPGQPPETDYRGAGAAGDTRRVFLWGRPGFVGALANDRSLGLYFGYADLPAGSGFDWQIRYFAGLRDGLPLFSRDEGAAVPLDLDSGRDGVQAIEVHDVVHQMSVAFVAALDKWVMFYGGGISDAPRPNLPTCGVLQLFAGYDCARVVKGNGAVRLRTADDPWGPWSPPQDVLVGGDPAVPGSGQYTPGGVLHHPGCDGDGCATRTETPYYIDGEYGFLYSANIIEEWAQPAENGVDIIWNASTWNPYRVILLRTRISP